MHLPRRGKGYSGGRSPSSTVMLISGPAPNTYPVFGGAMDTHTNSGPDLSTLLKEISLLRSEINDLNKTALQVRLQNKDILNAVKQDVLAAIEDAATSLSTNTGSTRQMEQILKDIFAFIKQTTPGDNKLIQKSPPRLAPPISENDAILMLRALRKQIWDDLETGPGPHGVLRKHMLEFLVSERIADQVSFYALIPKEEIEKTDPREIVYLDDIFKIIARIAP